MSDNVESRVVDTVKATGSSVVTKGLDVKKYHDKTDASEEEKQKGIEENVIGEFEAKDSDDIGDDGDVCEGAGDD